MELYKWEGHRDQAMQIMANLPNARLIYMTAGEKAILLQESQGGTVLQDASAFEILNAVGDINGGYFAVFNNIPVSEEGKAVFESRFSNRPGLIEKEAGFVAIRVLRPLDSDTYVILTLWEEEMAFINWQQSEAYSNAHAKRGTKSGIDKQPNIFPRPSFVETFRK